MVAPALGSEGKGSTLKKGFAALVAASVACVGGALGSGALSAWGTAGATTTPPAGAISSTGAPQVPSTGTGKTAGSITVSLSATGALQSGETLHLLLDPSTSIGIVDWSSFSISTTGIGYSTTGKAGAALNIVLGAKSAGTAASIHVTGIKVNTTGARGSIVVTPTLQNVTFSPTTATIGSLFPTPPSAPTGSLSSTGEPQLSPGETSGPAGTWTLTLSGNSTSGSGWVTGDSVLIDIAPPAGTNCAGNSYLAFSGPPSASVLSYSGVSATPSVAASITNNGPCGGSDPNELIIRFTDSVWFQSSGSVSISLGDVRYGVGPTASGDGVGPVVVSGTYLGTSIDTTKAANAYVGGLTVTADTPPVTVVPKAYDSPISPVSVVESSSAHVQPGYVCLTVASGSFNSTSTPTARAASGNGTVGATVTFQGTSGTGPTVAAFHVTSASTTAGTYRVSGLAVDAAPTSGAVAIGATEGTSATCTNDTGSIGQASAYSVASTAVTRIYGTTADATAAAELEHQFGASGTACPGRPGARPVVLATDSNYHDALSSAYLAGYLGTGELLTPTRRLSAAAANAIRTEGITDVYIVGGPLAVSTTVLRQVQAMTAYNCGGTSELTAAHPVHLTVTRIWGRTAYDTAQWVAQFPTASNVGTVAFPGAYQTTNSTGGTGLYNDTAGNGSSAPGTSATLPTAIVATGEGFADAESASALAYADHLPILLTTTGSLSQQVTSAISALHIKQVIVMGGEFAVSDAVVSSLEHLGVTVLRIAGKDYTGTATQLADFEMGSRSALTGLGWTSTGGVTVARGDFYADGLAGALVAAGFGPTHAHSPEPLVLTVNPDTVGGALTSFLRQAGRTGVDGIPSDRMSSLTLLGGPGALTQQVVDAMTSDL